MNTYFKNTHGIWNKEGLEHEDFQTVSRADGETETT
jgi:hypothetical protein